MDQSHSAGPGVILVVEDSLAEVLSSAGAQWRLQANQPSVDAMWQSLSSGQLDQHSRILIFSDSLAEGSPRADLEQAETASAVVAMAHAGARVFIAVWRSDAVADLHGRIAEAAIAQGVAAETLSYTLLPAHEGPEELLAVLRTALVGDVGFPDDGPADDGTSDDNPSDEVPADAGATDESATDVAYEPPVEPVDSAVAESPYADSSTATPAPHPIGISVAGPSGAPSLPPIGGPPVVTARTEGYPESASMELLNRAKRPGQVTITVTSSKGGSGKSTASILLGGSIARASADAGRPLSVCLVDLDTRDGQVASLIGKFMPTALNIRVQPVWDEERIRRNLVHADGLDIDTLLAPIRPRTADTVGPDFYRTIVRSLQRMYDIVIMDTSVQYLEPLIADVALGESDEILFVTTLASTAVQGMARALREITAPVEESGLGIRREKIGIMVNQSVANVGMERDQVLAAGLGVPVVGVIPLATKDVLTATNLNRMYALLDHPLIGPAYNELARACLPAHELAEWRSTPAAGGPEESLVGAAFEQVHEEESKRKGLFRR